jgi:hypothetical protein
MVVEIHFHAIAYDRIWIPISDFRAGVACIGRDEQIEIA